MGTQKTTITINNRKAGRGDGTGNEKRLVIQIENVLDGLPPDEAVFLLNAIDNWLFSLGVVGT